MFNFSIRDQTTPSTDFKTSGAPSSYQPRPRTPAESGDNEYISSSHISCKLFDPFRSRNCTNFYKILAENQTFYGYTYLPPRPTTYTNKWRRNLCHVAAFPYFPAVFCHVRWFWVICNSCFSRLMENIFML
jgi:hypothetical protein